MRQIIFALSTAQSLLLLVSPLEAQSEQRSTTAGVYTAAQAARGKDIYAGMCKLCHMPESHSGGTFATTWTGRSLADLFTYVSEQMPKNDPGGMPGQDIADVLAYMLHMNSLPPGTRELPPDKVVLDSIRLDFPKASRKDTSPPR